MVIPIGFTLPDVVTFPVDIVDPPDITDPVGTEEFIGIGAPVGVSIAAVVGNMIIPVELSSKPLEGVGVSGEPVTVAGIVEPVAPTGTDEFMGTGTSLDGLTETLIPGAGVMGLPVALFVNDGKGLMGFIKIVGKGPLG